MYIEQEREAPYNINIGYDFCYTASPEYTLVEDINSATILYLPNELSSTEELTVAKDYMKEKV